MYRLDLFRRDVDRLFYIMPFGRITSIAVAKQRVAVCINKNGSLFATWRYRGPDLDSSVEEELSVIVNRMQAAIASMKTDYTLYFEAQRVPSTAYETTNAFPDAVTRGMDAERCRLFSSGMYFESHFYATLLFLPPKDRQEKLKEFIVEGREKKVTKADDVLTSFGEQLYKLFMTCRNLRIEAEFLDEDELFTYLHSMVSDRPRILKYPKVPFFLDKYLYDTPLYGGLEPQLGQKHMRIIAPISYGKESIFGLFDELHRLDFSYRWVTRVYCMSKNDVMSELDGERRQWKGKMQSVSSTIADVTVRDSTQNAENIDDVAVDRIAEIRDAMNAVEGDHISFVYYSTSIIVMDENREAVEEKAKLIRQIFIERGMPKVKIEDFNAVDAWLGSIPGLLGANIRRPMLSTGNLIHMMPLALAWAGGERNTHLDGPPLLYTQTDGSTPYRLNLHIKDVGHSLMIGPTGAGKSVHLNCIEAAFRKYQNARVIIFDKGASSKILTMGVGGKFYDIGKSRSLSFQPLACIDDEDERQWALDWLSDYLREEGIEVTPEQKGLIRESLATVAGMQQRYRTMTTFISFLQSWELKTAFYPMSLADEQGNKGEYGEIFDSDEDHLSITSWQSFEMETLMNARRIVGTTLMYIFHRIENVVKSAEKSQGPTLIVLDECWVFFQNPMFAEKIKEWLKTLRKYNTSVLFATQSLDDIAKSPILDTVLSSCQSRIFLPDKLAITESRQELYRQFGLNKQQIYLLAHAQPQREYYYDSPQGSRLYNLALDLCPFTLSYAAVSDVALAKCQRIIETYGKEDFNTHWMRENELTVPTYPKEEEITL